MATTESATPPGSAPRPTSRPTSRARSSVLAALAAVMVAGLVVAIFASARPDGLRGVVSALRHGIRADTGELTQLGAPRADLELPTIEAVNAARAEQGIGPLNADELLGQVARSRSVDMAVNHYFSHVTPDGRDVFGILDEAQYPWATAGENLYLSPARDDVSVNEAMDFWKTSPAHAANLFNPAFDEAGIGVAEGDEGVYYTLVLGHKF